MGKTRICIFHFYGNDKIPDFFRMSQYRNKRIAFCNKIVAFCNKKPEALIINFCNKLLSHFVLVSVTFLINSHNESNMKPRVYYHAHCVLNIP